MQFDIQKFSTLTKRSQKDIALFIGVVPSFISMVSTNKRNLTIPQILKLQQLDKKAWEQCIGKEILDKLQGANIDIELWNTLTDGAPTRLDTQI